MKFRIDHVSDHSILGSALRPGDVVVDLGVNHGGFATAMHDVYGCRVIGYEPVPQLWHAMPTRERLLVHQRAVGGTRGRMSLHIYADRCASLRDDVSANLAERALVDVVTLADVLEEVSPSRVAILKVDIEGAELGMCDAARDQDLLRCDQITIEFHDWLFPETRDHVARTKARLRALGFRELKMSRTNGDVLFVNCATIPMGRLRYFWLRHVARNASGLGRMVRRWTSRSGVRRAAY